MKYTKDERIEIGRKIHESGVSNLNGARQFGISEESARRYRIMYEKSAGIPHDSSTAPKNATTRPSGITNVSYTDPDYSEMSREELLQELMEARIREERLKKGYMVKGVGANKEYLLFDNKNIK